MRLLCLFALAAAAFGQEPVEKPRPDRVAIAALEKAFNGRIRKASNTDPMEVMNAAQGVYLQGFGAVFTAELDLIMTPGLSPFRQNMTKPEIERVRARKADRLPMLKMIMREAMMETAATLTGMPPEENVVIAVALFHYHWEDWTGMPAQIVMQAPRKKLLGRASADSAIQVQEY
ncbi:MAG TPA: hypothetical protein VN442_06535 [Bryobacteraceae bacterium]|nr:hypothetical protein [Bryobacteraceae bacterium]